MIFVGAKGEVRGVTDKGEESKQLVSMLEPPSPSLPIVLGNNRKSYLNQQDDALSGAKLCVLYSDENNVVK